MSAPASRAARAESTRSGALGESFTIKGRRVAARTRATREAVACGELPKSMPPFATLGHEMFSSTAARPDAPSSARTTSTNSSSVSPQTLAMTVAWSSSSFGSFSSRKTATPTF